VAEWWGEPGTIAELEQDFFPSAPSQAKTLAYIASQGGAPIGFIQSYVAMGSGGGWWEQEADPGVRGIDQFLAHAEQLGQGLGSTMVHAFVQQLFLDATATTVQTDPSPRNTRAIRSYRKAGFAVHGEIVTPDGPALLMLKHRENHAPAPRQVV
jgi:RimJ/RimL family protein N-acetyltransferase